MKDNFLGPLGVALLIIVLVGILAYTIENSSSSHKEKSPEALSRMVLVCDTHLDSVRVFIIRDNKTGKEYFAIYHGGIIELK